MSNIKMTALVRHPFGTGTREQGEEYTASASEAKVLEGLGWASRSDAKATATPAKPTAPPTPAKPAPAPAKKVAPAKPSKNQAPAKGRYLTRDLKAQG